MLSPPGWETTSELGGKIGEAGGEMAGKAVGRAIGTAGGAIKGATESGVDGLKQGMAAGSGIGGKVGEAIGSMAGGVGGAVGGFFSGLQLGATKGRLFIPSYLGGLLMHIPPICEFLTVPYWVPFHPKVRINKKFALLDISLLTCGLGGVVKIWMENLMPHLKKAIMSNAVYYNEDDEAKMREMVADGEKTQAELDDWLARKEKALDYMAMYPDIEKVKPTNSDLINRMKNGKSGFMSEIYSYNDENGKKVYVMVFKGTDNDTQPQEDWPETNFPQNIGLETEQYYDTEQAAKEFKDCEEFKDRELEFAGHSKAGGEATLAAAVAKKKASAFNPAGVHDATFERANTDRETADQYVTSFHNHNGDVLNALQDHTYGLVPGAAGTRVGLDTPIPTLFGKEGPIAGHGMDNIIETLMQEIRKDPGTVRTKVYYA